jgi:hypothetical protein
VNQEKRKRIPSWTSEVKRLVVFEVVEPGVPAPRGFASVSPPADDADEEVIVVAFLPASISQRS